MRAGGHPHPLKNVKWGRGRIIVNAFILQFCITGARGVPQITGARVRVRVRVRVSVRVRVRVQVCERDSCLARHTVACPKTGLHGDSGTAEGFVVRQCRLGQR